MAAAPLAPALADDVPSSAGSNLVSNPGFEEGTAPWSLDNWAHNEASFLRDPQNPHSGKWSLRVELSKAVGTPNVMWAFPHLPVRGGMAVEIRFWARGVSNGAPVTVTIRQGGGAHAAYFSAEAALNDEWHEYAFTTLLPSDLAADDTSLRFMLKQPGVFWIDDVSVKELPPAQGGEAPAVNPIRNPSFEAGTDGWTATFRQREFAEAGEETGNNYPAPPGALMETRSDGTAPQGQRFLSFKVDPACNVVLTSAFFPARYGHKAMLRFSLRSDGAHPFSVGIGGGKNGNALFQRTPLTSSGGWQNYSQPVVLKPSEGGVYNLAFRFDQPGRYDLDAVSLTEEGQPEPVLYPPSAAIEPSSDAPVAHLYAPGDKPSFRLVVAGETPLSAVSCKVTVFDYLERKVAEVPIDLQTDSDGRAEKPFEIPADRQGAFRIEARDSSNDDLLAEQLYSVLPPLPPPAERPDSFFGGHVDLTPYGLEIARRGGFRWLRLYPPMSTKWMAVSAAPGQWSFQTKAVEQAHAQGFRLVGSFDTAPDFAADIDPNGPKNRWCRSYPPADLTAWKDYVTRCFTAFSPWIDAWELWNEPDGGYLQVKPGVQKDDVYLSLLQATREALDAPEAGGKPYFLLGPAVANINAPLGWQLLERGAGKQLDAFSFHFYSIAAGGDSPDVSYVLPLLAKYRTYTNREGQTMPLWDTEGGAYLAGSQSWLATYRIPPSSSMTPPQAAAAMVRTALFFKAMGVKRYFDYQLEASAPGRRVNEDGTCGFIEVTGIPGPGIAAHAAMVALTEDAAPDGFEDLGGTVRAKVAHFRNPATQGRIDVYWSGLPAPLADLAKLAPDDEVRDLMGNPIAPDEARAGEFPLYVLRGAKKP